MTQLDPCSSTGTTPSTPSAGKPPAKQDPPFNWRVTVGMAIGLVVLFGLLFGLRALGIFPPRTDEDPEIASVRATLAAVPTQQVVVAQQSTPAPTQASAPAPLGPIVLSTPAPTSAAPGVATVASAPAVAPTSALAQEPATVTQKPLAAGAEFETAPTPVPSGTSDQAFPTVATTPASSAPAEATPSTSGSVPSTQPTPVAVNLAADLGNAILQGYTNYWTVRVNAMRDPTDPSIDLGSVMDGSELVGAQKTLAQYRDAGEAFDSDVKHTIWITYASAEEAVVVDRYVGNTISLDPGSKQPLTSQPLVQSFSDRFLLRNIEGTWKVVQEEPE